SALAAFGVALFLWAFPDRIRIRAFEIRFVLIFIAAGVLAFGLACIQVLPTLEWLGQLGLQVEAPQPVLDRHQGQGLFSRDISKNPSSAGIWIPDGSARVVVLGLLDARVSPFLSSPSCVC